MRASIASEASYGARGAMRRHLLISVCSTGNVPPSQRTQSSISSISASPRTWKRTLGRKPLSFGLNWRPRPRCSLRRFQGGYSERRPSLTGSLARIAPTTLEEGRCRGQKTFLESEISCPTPLLSTQEGSCCLGRGSERHDPSCVE